ncbi:MAG: MCP four helix bundle domain-containing protein [Dehalococcoidia bacterium]|nr:MCP four helix bundle domain-containing protein [Dehalococcoidia bacterium]
MKLNLQAKLMGGFAIVILFLVAVASVGLMRLNEAVSRTETMYADNVLGVQHVLLANRYYISFAREMRSAVLAQDDAARAKAVEEAKLDLAEGSKAFAEYGEVMQQGNAEQQKAYAELKERVDATTATRAKAIELVGGGKVQEGWALEQGQMALVVEQNSLLDQAGEDEAELARASRDRSESAGSSARTLVIGLTIAAALLGLGIAFFLARSVTSGAAAVVDRLRSLQGHCLSDLEHGFKALAAGDLSIPVQPVTQPIANPGADEIGQAAATVNDLITLMVSTIASYNESRTTLSELIREVQQGASSISGAATSLQENSDQMAAATGQIAVAINEVTRSAVNLSSLSQDSAREVERVAAGSQQLAASAAASSDSATSSRDEATQIGQRIQLVAAASEEVASAAEESRTAAQHGQEAVREAVRSMESIAAAVGRASSTVDQLGEYGQQIGNIVKAIDEIASQTNLLALNAAIEAARAGEQGRGFAVVAENVRSLAERSSESTKEIADLIAKVQNGTEEAVQAMAVGVQDVEAGRSITSQAGDALESIIVSVQQSAARMKEIAHEVGDLATGAGRIVGSAEHIASMASESARGAGDMAQGTSRVTEAIVQVSATSEETSASAEEVSASTEELSAQSEELAATASRLTDMAAGLNAATARFKLA